MYFFGGFPATPGHRVRPWSQRQLKISETLGSKAYLSVSKNAQKCAVDLPSERQQRRLSCELSRLRAGAVVLLHDELSKCKLQAFRCGLSWRNPGSWLN